MAAHLKMTFIATAFVLALAGMAQATPITVANYSFEAPDLSGGPGYNFAPSLADQGGSGWSWLGGETAGLQTASIAGLVNDDGSQVCWSNGGVAFQATGYTVQTGDVFTLTVDVANRSSAWGGQRYRVAMYAIDDPATTPTTADIVEEDRQAMNSWAQDTWKKEVTISYTATAGDVGKTIGVWLDCESNQAMFDYVRLDVVSIPEPATMTLIGLGGLGLLFRRKR